MGYLGDGGVGGIDGDAVLRTSQESWGSERFGIEASHKQQSD
jgi:hypothetical protein